MGEGMLDRFAWAQSCCAFSSEAVRSTGVGRYTNKPTPIPAKSTNAPRLRIKLNLTTLAMRNGTCVGYARTSPSGLGYDVPSPATVKSLCGERHKKKKGHRSGMGGRRTTGAPLPLPGGRAFSARDGGAWRSTGTSFGDRFNDRTMEWLVCRGRPPVTQSARVRKAPRRRSPGAPTATMRN